MMCAIPLRNFAKTNLTSFHFVCYF